MRLIHGDCLLEMDNTSTNEIDLFAHKLYVAICFLGIYIDVTMIILFLLDFIAKVFLGTSLYIPLPVLIIYLGHIIGTWILRYIMKNNLHHG